VFWPGDLLKDEIPNARILTFDYDFGPSSLVTKGRVLLEAKTLIRDIDKLSQDTSSQCPLVFCAHSFGGLLLKTVSNTF
jgi:protein SERAC1